MRKKLTDKTIANVRPPKKGRLELSDTLEPGLALRITEDDRRSWAVRVWTGPKDKRVQRRVTLGHPRERDGGPVLTLAQARQAARDVKQAAAEGKALVPGDGLKGAQTWGELSEEYITWVKGERRPSTAAEIRRILHSDDLAAWSDRPAKAIGPDDVRALRDAVHERGPSMGTKVLRIVSGMGNWAVDEGKLAMAPAKGIRTRAPETERDRVLTDAEIGTFWRACDLVGYPCGPIGKLLLLTATRLREVGQMPWSELNGYRVWSIPGIRRKNGKPLTLHLSHPAVQILRELAEAREKVSMLKASPYVFVSAKGGRIGSFSYMKEKIDEAMTAEVGEPPAHFALHDLRRTAASTLARLNHPPHVIEKVLGHSQGETLGGPIARIYNRFDYQEECAEALEALGQFVTALAEPVVVPLRRA
jgi:integrase